MTFFILYYRISRIKCVVRHLYTDRKWSFTCLAHLRLKQAVDISVLDLMQEKQ